MFYGPIQIRVQFRFHLVSIIVTFNIICTHNFFLFNHYMWAWSQAGQGIHGTHMLLSSCQHYSIAFILLDESINFLDKAMLEALKTSACHMATKITSLGRLKKGAWLVVGDWDPSLVINPQPLSCSPYVCFATHLHILHLPLHGAISKHISLFRVYFCMVNGFWFGMIQHSIRKLPHGLRFQPPHWAFCYRTSHGSATFTLRLSKQPYF